MNKTISEIVGQVNDFDTENFEFAKWVFEQEEGRKANLNDSKDMNAIAILEVGIRYARLH